MKRSKRFSVLIVLLTPPPAVLPAREYSVRVFISTSLSVYVRVIHSCFSIRVSFFPFLFSLSTAPERINMYVNRYQQSIYRFYEHLDIKGNFREILMFTMGLLNVSGITQVFRNS